MTAAGWNYLFPAFFLWYESTVYLPLNPEVYTYILGISGHCHVFLKIQIIVENIGIITYKQLLFNFIAFLLIYYECNTD